MSMIKRHGDPISRRDVRLGRVVPHVGTGGVVTPPGLMINTESLAEHQARMIGSGWTPWNREQAARHYEADEVAEYFGPEPEPETTLETKEASDA